MQGKAVIVVVALLVVLLIGSIIGIAYLLLRDYNDGAVIAVEDFSKSDSYDISTADITDIAESSESTDSRDDGDESNEEVTHDAPYEDVDLTGHPLVGTWKNTFDDIYGVDVSIMETTLEFRATAIAIRESVGISFRYEWVLDDDVLHMKSFGAWGNTHNPENDRIYTLTWITPDSFSVDFYNNDETVIFDRVR